MLALGRTVLFVFAFILSAVLFFSQTATAVSAVDHNR
jgi:hypothetical protein